MTYESALEKVKGYLHAQFDVPLEAVTPGANLFTGLALDSIDALDMVGALEADLGVAVKEQELRKLMTVEDVVQYILRNAPSPT